MDRLDGNAIGGMLQDVFGTEMTAVVGICASCGTANAVARLYVYRQAPGIVVRCPACTAVLMVFVANRGVTCVDTMGLASLG